MTTRREFIGAGTLLLSGASALSAPVVEPAGRKLSILFLGGTGFIGPHQIELALARGHTVSMFNRGRNTGLFGDRVEELVGNRDSQIDGGLTALAGDRRWDVVVDNSGYVPRHVRDSVALLKDRCDRYIYTSTVSVYDFDKTPVVDNGSPVFSEYPDTEEITWQSYGPLKAECDLLVQQAFGRRATIVRPTYVVGPGDSTDRFTYWVERLHRGGDVICPAGQDLEVSWIDVRDLSRFMMMLAENDTPGVYNASGPASPMNNLEFMHGMRATTAGDVRLHWVDHEILAQLEFSTPMFEWTSYSIHIDASAAVAAGMTYRSLADSIRDTHEWWMSQPGDRRSNPRRWPTAEQEKQVLEYIDAGDG